MGTREKIALLAEYLKVGNEVDGLTDHHIVIKSVRFFNREGRLLARVEPTSMNKEERLLLQCQMLDDGGREILCTDKFRWRVRSIFADRLTNQVVNLKEQSLLFWMLNADFIVPECEG